MLRHETRKEDPSMVNSHFKWVSAIVKFEANMEAVILRQSVQLQRNVLTNPGPLVGCLRSCQHQEMKCGNMSLRKPKQEDLRAALTNPNCTAPQKQVAVASSSLDHPSLTRLANGM
jgi:hypothetical protein